SVDVKLTFPDSSTRDVTASGTALVVANDASPIGAGWGIAGVDRLVATTGGVLWGPGAAGSRLFATSGNGTFPTPPQDFGTLTQDPGTGLYTYTAKDQTRTYFNSQGLQTSIVNTDGQALSYAYDPQGRLVQVTAPDGGSTVLSYFPGTGLLAQITEPGG